MHYDYKLRSGRNCSALDHFYCNIKNETAETQVMDEVLKSVHLEIGDRLHSSKNRFKFGSFAMHLSL